MQNAVDAKTTYPANFVAGPADRVFTLPGRRAETWRRRLVNLTLVSSDTVLALFVWQVACLAQMFWAPGYLSGTAVAVGIVPVAFVWVGLRATQGLYPGSGMNDAEELKRQTYALLATLAFAAVFALGFQIGNTISRFLLLLVFTGLLFLAPLMRHYVKRWIVRQGMWGAPAIILGAEDSGARVEELLSREWALGYRPVAVFDDPFEEQLTVVGKGDDGMPQAEILAGAAKLGREHGIDNLLLAMPHVPREYLAGLANLASVHFKNVVIIPDLTGFASSTMVARDFAGTVGIEIRHSLLCPTVRRAKRALDLTATVIGGLVILPFFLLLSALVWIESRGRIFYSDRRMGRNGKLFSCIKFRTMVSDAEDALQRILEENPESREEYDKYHKLRDDPRVTRIGRFLRKTSLDELPQLWNVLKGEMSLVGPRPYLPRESNDIGMAQGEILRVYPGVTGPWQVGGRSNACFAERVGMDAYYVRNWSIWLDLVILIRTVRALVLDRGAF